jgi:PAS domain S-box-containing protein
MGSAGESRRSPRPARAVALRRLARYLLALVVVAGALALRISLVRVTGTGAPFVPFFAAVLVSSIVAGVGPGVCSLLLSIPVAGYMFVVGAGYPISQGIVQTLLFTVDGIIAISLAAKVERTRRALQETDRQRQRANRELEQSMAHTRDLIDLAPDAFFLADLDARILDVNEAACKLLGYQRSELVGKTIFDIIPTDDVARLARVKADLLAPGTTSRAEWVQIRKDGSAVPVEVSSNILPDGRWQAFVRDIGPRKRMESELRESENKFRTLAETIPQLVWITRPDGWNVYFNQRWVDYTGLTLEESHGHGWNVPFHPDDRQRAWDAWQQAVRTDGVYSLECRLRRADGAYQWWLIRGASLHDESGHVTSWFGTCTDVDDIKRTEEALRRARDEREAVHEQLRESEERFRLTIDEAPIGMALVALDGRFVRVIARCRRSSASHPRS